MEQNPRNFISILEDCTKKQIWFMRIVKNYFALYLLVKKVVPRAYLYLLVSVVLKNQVQFCKSLPAFLLCMLLISV